VPVLFNSWTYVLFLVVVVGLFWVLPHRCRLGLLLVASYVFYMSWSPPFGLIYGPVIFVDALYFFGLSKLMLRYPAHKKTILIGGIVTELALLSYFKYANFLYHSAEMVAAWVGFSMPHATFHIFLPLAISFTNFILISYLIDVYRGDEPVDFSLWSFVTYVSFFPHLIAGPIVRAKELVHQFDQHLTFRPSYITQGAHLFLFGLGIKLYVADLLAPYVELIYSTPALQGFDTAWVATYGFAIQILCDFWGYTLMAQGSAVMLGYTLPDNFHAPYFAVNITDFWRRWHMSLSRWLRDYLYIPLGGSHHGRLNTYRNLFITMGLGGLWHGASWHFVIWGLYQGVLLSLHKLAVKYNVVQGLTNGMAWVVTFHAVCVGWVFFRAETFDQALQLLGLMMNPATVKGLWASTGTINLPTNVNGVNVLAIVVLFLGLHWVVRTYKDRLAHRPLVRDTGIGLSYATLLYLFCVMQPQPQQFIYFQF